MNGKKKSFFGILLSLALVFGMMPMLGVPVFAEDAPETWSTNNTFSTDQTFDTGVKVTSDITLTIDEEKTVTVNGGIDATGHTLTVTGGGTLIVKGADGNAGANHDSDPIKGERGGNSFTGDIIINGAAVELTGGSGGKGGNSDSDAAQGGNGGSGINGNITVNVELIAVPAGNENCYFVHS